MIGLGHKTRRGICELVLVTLSIGFSFHLSQHYTSLQSHMQLGHAKPFYGFLFLILNVSYINLEIFFLFTLVLS